MSNEARQNGTTAGLSLTFAATLYEWLEGAGLLSVPTLLAAAGLLATIVINLDRIAANVRLARSWLRPTPCDRCKRAESKP